MNIINFLMAIKLLAIVEVPINSNSNFGLISLKRSKIPLIPKSGEQLDQIAPAGCRQHAYGLWYVG